jgi:hypothetical protein
VERMDIFDREDFIEFDELGKTIDIDNIPYEKLMHVFIGFICDELINRDIHFTPCKLYFRNNMPEISEVIVDDTYKPDSG